MVPIEEFVNQTLPNRNIFGVKRNPPNPYGNSAEENTKTIDYSTFLKLTVKNILN